ncbi:hypothetical protein HL658_09905 [Azospirillum sp. RWY-5-1]|uniref:Uncharacterized protein n=1 Tax=Azospirillum oleiclasticum TaxID=2735135 RepID=A0ABX2T762_9PROT|nr:hypothetical protein [Azospirillum oleiclasticum]NYZ12866.1 hypothetical protein [Azospirillum oleiclasticum]NYZ20026.1 hypothetical protein [Azospirillum oleiclasticum]
MTTPQQAPLAVTLGLSTAALRLRGGTPPAPAECRQLARLLTTTVLILTGRPAPADATADPLALVRDAIEHARTAGVAARDVVDAVNDALERATAPAGR